jgi:protein SCO1/2
MITSLWMRKNGLDLRVMLSLVALVIVAGAVALVAIGGSSHAKAQREQALAAHFDAAAVLEPPTPAPPLALHNYLGQMVNIADYRGKAVLVTFLYTNCPDICPLIASDLRVAQNMMGPSESSKAQIIAVSVDPRGDTPKAVAAFLARHGMTGRMQYLIGSPRELSRVWEAWGVGSSRDAAQPQFINHTGIVYGITGSGKRLTVYAPEFKPAEIAHDVPLLAAR